MKTILLCALLLLFLPVSHAQDTIRKHDGSELLVKVQEINNYAIVYKLYSQPDGPLRKVVLSAVAEIAYADGTVEHITSAPARETAPQREKPSKDPASYEPGSINNTGHTVVIPRNGKDLKIRPGERFPASDGQDVFHLANGKYLEGMMGYGHTSKLNGSGSGIVFNPELDEVKFASNITLGIRFGSRYYLGDREKHVFGLHVAWFTITGLLNDYGKGDIVAAPVNIGLSAAFLLDEESSIEINTVTGFVVSTIYRNNTGLNYGLAVKFRYQRLYTGLDFSRTSAIFGSKSEFSNVLSFTLGAKL